MHIRVRLFFCVAFFVTVFFVSSGCGVSVSPDGLQGELSILNPEQSQESFHNEVGVDTFRKETTSKENHQTDNALDASHFNDAKPDLRLEQGTPEQSSEPTIPEPMLEPIVELGPESQPERVFEPGLEPSQPDKVAQDKPPSDGNTSGVGTPCRANGATGVCRFVQNCTGNQKPVPGFCPGTSSVQCCIPNTPSGTSYCAVKIPASCQPVSAFSKTCNCSVKPPTPSHAGKTERAGQNKCPNGMVRVGTFCIDQYEAALVEILPSGQIQAWSPFLNPGNRNIKAVSIGGVKPQGYISGTQAAKACKAAGKRLCSDTEWLRACQGTQKNTFPYGKTKQKGWCNEDRSLHPAIEYFGHSRNCVFSYISHICINQIPNSLATTGSHPKCVTSEKVHDMMGNLHEWTASSSGIFRGGFYADTYRNGPGCLYRTTAHTVGHWDYSTGFRCCADPQP